MGTIARTSFSMIFDPLPEEYIPETVSEEGEESTGWEIFTENFSVAETEFTEHGTGPFTEPVTRASSYRILIEGLLNTDNGDEASPSERLEAAKARLAEASRKYVWEPITSDCDIETTCETHRIAAEKMVGQAEQRANLRR